MTSMYSNKGLRRSRRKATRRSNTSVNPNETPENPPDILLNSSGNESPESSEYQISQGSDSDPSVEVPRQAGPNSQFNHVGQPYPPPVSHADSPPNSNRNCVEDDIYLPGPSSVVFYDINSPRFPNAAEGLASKWG